MRYFLRGENLGICLCRQYKTGENYQHCFVSNAITESCYISNQTSEIAYSFPLYLSSEQEDIDEHIPNNLNQQFVKEFSEKLNSSLSPEDIFYYIYAILHCPTYRSRYVEQLKIDFPRLPLTENKSLFEKLAKAGNELVNLHLLGKNPLDKKATTIFDDQSRWQVRIGEEQPDNSQNWEIKKIDYIATKKRVYVNKDQYFEAVEPDIWELKIGSYQVLHKWLKDRKEHRLTPNDLEHYLKIIVSLRETRRLMETIDGYIKSWPLH